MNLRQRIRRWFEDHRLVTFKYLLERTEAARADERARMRSVTCNRESRHFDLWHSGYDFLNEYESYRTGDAVSFTPSPEVLEAFRKAVKG